MALTLTEIFGLIVWVLAALYVLGVLVVIVLDNRTPQSTFAWLRQFFITWEELQ